jgi:hypothetical protein
MLKLLLFCLWPSWIVVPFDRSILIVLKIGLFVNCVSAKPAQTFFLGSTSSQSATSTSTTTAATNATDTATSSARESARSARKSARKVPSFFVVVGDCVQCMSCALVMLKKRQKKRQKRQQKRQKKVPETGINPGPPQL